MSRKNRKATDSHPWNFSTVDLQDVARAHDRWLDFTSPLDFLSVDVVRRAQNEATRGAYAQLQWLWEQLEPADSILATCVERRLGALKRIPWDIRKKDGLSDAEDLLAEAQLRTVQDFANAIENLDEGIEALAQASFRHYRHIQLLETEAGALRLNLTENWNWARDGYAGEWQWNPAATYGLTRGMPLPVDPASIVTRVCARPIDQPAMMLCLDRKNAKAQWLVYNGRYGTPPVFAIMPQGVDEALRKEYIKFAMQCVSNAAGVLPAGADVKTVTPGNGGPDTFSRMIDLSTQELVLRATGGLMTMLTAPGAGTNTATGSAHQDAFDDLAASEAEQIANLLQEKLFAPVLEQWHPGQPHLVEFVMRRPDSDNAAGSVANIATLAQNGYRTPDEQVAELTGLQVRSSAEAQPPHGATSAALNSLRVRYAPTMLYPPARAAFERALNAKVTSGAEAPNAQVPPVMNRGEMLPVVNSADEPGSESPSGRFLGAPSAARSTPTQGRRGDSASEEEDSVESPAESELPLNEGELEALRLLGGGLNAAQVAADAEYTAKHLRLTIDPSSPIGYAEAGDLRVEHSAAAPQDEESPEEEEELATNAARRFYNRDLKGRFKALGFHRKGGRSSRGKKLLGKTGSPNLIEAGDSKRKTKRALVKAFLKAKDGKKVSTGYKMGSHEVTLAPGDKAHWGRDHAERKEHPKKIPSEKLAEMTMHSPRKNERANTVTIKDGDNVLVYAPENQPAIPSGGKVNRKQKGKPVVGKNWYRTGEK